MSLIAVLWSCQTSAEPPRTLRFASYNVAMYRDSLNQLQKDLSSTLDSQAQNISEIIQHVRPDVIALMEFDFDSSGKTLSFFQEYYLMQPRTDEEPIEYPYQISIPSNTGILSGFDLNRDDKIALPDDGFGYGRYPGQYAYALLSRFPIVDEEVRTFQHLRWADVPGAERPTMSDGDYYYPDEVWDHLKISSKNHAIIPIMVGHEKIHVILAHPTPPVFDGIEDRNGIRNYDEIRVLADLISDRDYLVDDHGSRGGLSARDKFVIMGDLNADIVAGDSKSGAIEQLLSHPRINSSAAVGDLMPQSLGALEQEIKRRSQPEFATSFFGLRIDYVLPSEDLNVRHSGVFWPSSTQPLHDVVMNRKTSDHLLVFVDISLE